MFLFNTRCFLFLCTSVVAFGQNKPDTTANVSSTAPESVIENVFHPGFMVIDTNGDHIADAICGKVIVASNPSAAENTAAANLAARLGYETSALNLPIVVTATADAPLETMSKGSGDSCPAVNTNLWVGRAAFPGPLPEPVESLLSGLQIGEGGVFAIPGGMLLAGNDPAGTLAAGDGYAAHAPYQWSVSGAKLAEIAADVHARLKDERVGGTALLIGVTYGSGLPGIRQAVLTVSGSSDRAGVRTALQPADGPSPLKGMVVRELELRFADAPPLRLSLMGGAAPTTAAATGPTIANGDGGAESAGETRRLDLRELYGIHGLLTGTPKKLVPEAVASRLYVPDGAAGVAMANLAARIGLETTGIELPIAYPATGADPAQVHTGAVLAGTSPLAEHVADLLGAPAGTAADKILPGQFAKAASPELVALKPGEGELAVVDRAFGANPALLVRGDAAGSAAALNYASGHLPYLWEPSKKYANLDEMRLELQSFFSLRSSTGQATAALYDLDHWLTDLTTSANGKQFTSVSAEVDVDEADPKLAKFIRDEIQARLKPAHLDVITGSLHAGTKCCASAPDLHNKSLVLPFKQAEPTFREDFTIPWAGKRLIEAVKSAANLPKGQPVVLEARVSEGPEERRRLQQQIVTLLQQAGADPSQLDVKILCTYKSGYSWLVDEVEPLLKNKGVASLRIEFAPYPDPTRQTTMRSRYRWVQELFPVDEVLSRDLAVPLKDVHLEMMKDATDPTYRVHALGADGHELLTRDFTVKVVSRPYSDQFPEYETVTVETGWVSLTVGGKVLVDQRIESDIEQFWDHYQATTLPRIYKMVMAQNDGKPRVEYQPLFDTLRVSYKLSEPDYAIGIGQERISSLEGVQEDLFFNTENFFYMFGDLESTGRMDYQGRILPVAYPSRDGEDGEVHIEYYAKDAGFPQVRLTWKLEGDPVEHERTRDIPVIASAGHVRLVAARVEAGSDSLPALTWRMPVDFAKDNYAQWIVLAEKTRVDRTISSAEQATAQLAWLAKMHAGGLYADSFNYPHLRSLGFQFEAPLPLGGPEHAKKPILTAEIAVAAPLTARPMITDFTPTPLAASGQFVQWQRPIAPAEEEHVLSRLSTYPGVDVYWMGRSYLGHNLWAADMTLPTPSALHSMAKATTLKASIIYSGRQHANEVSSTSHILRLAEELVLDPTRRETLNRVNVVVHPITNVDGAELSIDLAKITPENMLHAGYHASLTADVTSAQNDPFPVYPESATRRLLWQAWLPDAFLNPHGYPTHEWVQPFSEYSAWVISRQGAETGRTNWVPRGWFTSLGYLGDDDHLDSRAVTYALRDKIVANMANTPGVLDLNARENERYARFQHFDVDSYQQPIYKGVRINMALKGADPDGMGNTGPSVGVGGLMVRYPDITYDDGYTEVPDETAYGDFLKLVASAGLAYDHAHLEYLSEGKLDIKHTQRDLPDGVAWKVERKRPIMPLLQPGMPVPPLEGAKP